VSRRLESSGVAAVVLHWGPANTLACLRSLAASTHPADVIVVDNGTHTLSVDAVTAAAPGATLISLAENLGYTGGNNAGIREALTRGASFVLLMNNDAEVEPTCIAALLEAAWQPGKRVAAVGAKNILAADPSKLWCAYGRLTYGAALVERVGAGMGDDACDEVRSVDWVPGCGVLMTRDALETIGLLDDEFFAFHEDVDWCTTAREAGFDVRYAPRARVVHEGSFSVNGVRERDAVPYLAARNTVVFARKHGRWRDRLWLTVAIAVSIPLAYARGRFRGRLRPLVRGYCHGLLRRPIPHAQLGLR